VHARQAVVSGAAASVNNLRVNPLAIVSHPQPKVPLVIVDFHLYTFGVRMAEGIPQRLASNPVDFVADDRRQVPRFALHLHTKLGTMLTGLSRREFGGKRFSDDSDRPG
jgi:hypothetical protein